MFCVKFIRRLASPSSVRNYSSPAAKGREWTKDEDAKILQLSAEKIPRVEIAETMSRTFDGVVTRLSTLRRNSGQPKQQPREWSAEEHAKLIKLFRAGTPLSALATALGRSLQATRMRIYRTRLQEGLPSRTLRLTREEHDEVVRLRAQGQTFRSIAATMGKSIRHVQLLSSSSPESFVCHPTFNGVPQPAAVFQSTGPGSRFTPAQDRKMMDLYREGYPIGHIAAAVKRTITPVARRLGALRRQHSLDARSSRYSTETDDLILDLYQKGASMAEISVACARPVAGVESRLAHLRRRLGLKVRPRSRKERDL